MIFNPVPSKNPINAPKADLKTPSVFPFVCTNSPINAPKKGPKIIPHGPVKNPIIRPTVVPVTAALLPPNFFVIKIGHKLSSTETATAKTAVKTRQKTEISL